VLLSVCAAGADEPVAMDTDNIDMAVTAESDLTAQPLTPLTSTDAVLHSAPSASVCLLAPQSAVQKDTLEDVGLDLAEPFALGNVQSFRDNCFSTVLKFREEIGIKQTSNCQSVILHCKFLTGHISFISSNVLLYLYQLVSNLERSHCLCNSHCSNTTVVLRTSNVYKSLFSFLHQLIMLHTPI